MTEPTITITLAPEEWNIVLGALGDAPFKVSAPIIGKIQQQAAPQIAGASGPAPDAADPREDPPAAPPPPAGKQGRPARMNGA